VVRSFNKVSTFLFVKGVNQLDDRLKAPKVVPISYWF